MVVSQKDVDDARAYYEECLEEFEEILERPFTTPSEQYRDAYHTFNEALKNYRNVRADFHKHPPHNK